MLREVLVCSIHTKWKQQPAGLEVWIIPHGETSSEGQTNMSELDTGYLLGDTVRHFL